MPLVIRKVIKQTYSKNKLREKFNMNILEIVKAYDGYKWNGHNLQVQKAKETFLQKTAKLRSEKVTDDKITEKAEFKLGL